MSKDKLKRAARAAVEEDYAEFKDIVEEEMDERTKAKLVDIREGLIAEIAGSEAIDFDCNIIVTAEYDNPIEAKNEKEAKKETEKFIRDEELDDWGIKSIKIKVEKDKKDAGWFNCNVIVTAEYDYPIEAKNEKVAKKEVEKIVRDELLDDWGIKSIKIKVEKG